MKNLDIRKEIAEAGVRFWQVAEGMGWRDDYFSRKLRKELSDQEKVKIRDIINELANEKE